MSSKVERKDVFWYIVLRLIIVTSILVAAVIIQLAGAAIVPMVPIFSLLLAIYVLSAAYFLFYAFGKHYAVQAYVQVIFDLFLITAFVYISGGIASSTYFLYVFAVIAASLVISGSAAYLAASLSAILFGLLVDGKYFGIIPYFSPEQAVVLSLGEILFTMFIAWATFFVIAFLMNYLSKEPEKDARGAPAGPEGAHHQGAAGRSRAASRRPWPMRSGTPWRPSPDRSRS